MVRLRRKGKEGVLGSESEARGNLAEEHRQGCWGPILLTYLVICRLPGCIAAFGKPRSLKARHALKPTEQVGPKAKRQVPKKPPIETHPKHFVIRPRPPATLTMDAVLAVMAKHTLKSPMVPAAAISPSLSLDPAHSCKPPHLGTEALKLNLVMGHQCSSPRSVTAILDSYLHATMHTPHITRLRHRRTDQIVHRRTPPNSSLTLKRFWA